MISIIIPAYNEEKTIGEVINSVHRVFSSTPYEIIVVDDGSSDTTGLICESQQNIKYIHLPENHGKGFAIREGIKNASGDYIAVQDADLEYNPETLFELCSKTKDNTVIYGKRDRIQGYYFYKLGNAFLSGICNLLYRSKLFDIYTCYKIIPTHIAKSLELKSNGFEIEAEITGKLLKRKVPIIEFPITYSSRKFHEGKKIRGKDALIGIWTLIKNSY